MKSSTKDKAMRLVFDDGTAAILGFYPKGESKSSVAVQHMKLPDKAAVENTKRFWAEKLDALAGMIG